MKAKYLTAEDFFVEAMKSKSRRLVRKLFREWLEVFMATSCFDYSKANAIRSYKQRSDYG